MKPLVLVLCIVFCATSFSSARPQGVLEQRVSELSQKISNGLTENQKRTIAVLEFVDLRGNVTDFGRFIAEELITNLYETKKFKVIERQLINKIITEQKLSLTGIVDHTSAQKLGRLLGVDAIATGTVTDLGKSLRVNARLIDTTTGEIFGVAQTEVVKDDAVTRLMSGNDSSTTSEDPRKNQSSQQPKSKSQKVDAQFFTFELLRCRLSGTTVACDLTITNNDKDRRLAICASGVIFDDFGNSYEMYGAQLANDQGRTAQAYLISGLKTKAKVTFERVSPEATKITLMNLNICQVEGGAGFNLEYRNISLKEGSASEPDASPPGGDQRPSIQFGRHETLTIYGNRQWTDSGIDVSPGMRLQVNASGRVYITGENSASNQILGPLLNRNGRAVAPRSVSTTALLAKIKYTRGGESDVLRVGDKNTLIVEDGEAGRLLFGIDDKNVRDNSGYFTVMVKW